MILDKRENGTQDVRLLEGLVSESPPPTLVRFMSSVNTPTFGLISNPKFPCSAPTSMICSKSVELETKEPLLESSEPSTFPLLTLAAEAEDEEGVELPLRNFDPEMSEGEKSAQPFRVATQKCVETAD